MNRRLLKPLGAALLATTLLVPGVLAAPALTARSLPFSSYVALGPSAEADVARLQDALRKVPGVEQGQMRRVPGGVVLRMRGEKLSEQMTLLNEAAKSRGYVLRPALPRYYAAAGPMTEPDLQRLREALGKVEGVDQLELSQDAAGAAVRVSGVPAGVEMLQAAKGAGYTLRQVASYVVSGPSAPADLTRLRRALATVPGITQVEIQGLKGGATLLVSGDASDVQLTSKAKAAGFVLWPLASVASPLKFRIGIRPGTPEQGKLLEVLKAVPGIGDAQIRSEEDGPLLLVAPGRAGIDAVLSASSQAGFTLSRVDSVTLPTLKPEAGRNTPPDYDERVAEELARPGEVAPDFKLRTLDGKELAPSQFRGRKPVVLMFGSCT